MKVMAQKSAKSSSDSTSRIALAIGWAVFNADCQAPNQQAAADGSCANDNDDEDDDDGDDDDGGDSKC